MKKEICICAAIMTDDGKIIRGHRHGDCMITASRMKGFTRNKIGLAEQGFITSFNRFVGREEGRKLQDAAGVLSEDRDGYCGKTLFSEDLY